MKITYEDVLEFQGLRVDIEKIEETIFSKYFREGITGKEFKEYIRQTEELVRNFSYRF